MTIIWRQPHCLPPYAVRTSPHQRVFARIAHPLCRHSTMAGPCPCLEVFVHGALCVAFSGQCLTSESLGQRSANRGECAQACRLPYVWPGGGRDPGGHWGPGIPVRYTYTPKKLTLEPLLKLRLKDASDMQVIVIVRLEKHQLRSGESRPSKVEDPQKIRINNFF